MEQKGSPVAVALLSVLKSDLYVQKAGINREQNYRYASEADFLEAVRPKLAAAGVAVVPSYEVIETHEGQTKAGTPNTRITLAGRFTFIHAESGDRLDVVTIGQGTDTQDKAAYKAMTGALKYALRQTFLIETGDDPEKDSDPQARPSAPSPASRPVGPGPRPETAPAAPVSASGGSPALYVKSVDKTAGEKNGKAWTRYSITFSDGRKASTFSETEGRVAENAKSQGAAVVAGFEQKGQYLNLISLKFAGEPGPEEMPDDDAVPF